MSSDIISNNIVPHMARDQNFYYIMIQADGEKEFVLEKTKIEKSFNLISEKLHTGN